MTVQLLLSAILRDWVVGVAAPLALNLLLIGLVFILRVLLAQVLRFLVIAAKQELLLVLRLIVLHFRLLQFFVSVLLAQTLNDLGLRSGQTTNL